MGFACSSIVSLSFIASIVAVAFVCRLGIKLLSK